MPVQAKASASDGTFCLKRASLQASLVQVIIIAVVALQRKRFVCLFVRLLVRIPDSPGDTKRGSLTVFRGLSNCYPYILRQQAPGVSFSAPSGELRSSNSANRCTQPESNRVALALDRESFR